MTQITLYTKDYCPFCKSAKQILNAKSMPFTEIDVLEQLSKFDEMVARSGRRTVPQIFFNEKHIGGHSDLVEYFRMESNRAA